MGQDRLHQHPGFRLKMELRSRKITQKNFAASMGIQPSHLSELIKGKRNVTEQIAQKLEELLNIPSAEWLRMQASYDYQLKIDTIEKSAERDADCQLIEYDAIYDMRTIFKYVGISKDSAIQRLDFCRSKLRFKSPAFQARTIQGYFHKSEKTGLDTRMIATWSVLAMYEAMQEQEPTNKFAIEKCDELAYKLSEIFNDNHNTINRVERIFNEYGVKFCIVPKVPHASIDGFSFYCDGIPCIVVTKRFNRIDNFAFAILHEVGHLKMHLSPNAEKQGKKTIVNFTRQRFSFIFSSEPGGLSLGGGVWRGGSKASSPYRLLHLTTAGDSLELEMKYFPIKLSTEFFTCPKKSRLFFCVPERSRILFRGTASKRKAKAARRTSSTC